MSIEIFCTVHSPYSVEADLYFIQQLAVECENLAFETDRVKQFLSNAKEEIISRVSRIISNSEYPYKSVGLDKLISHLQKLLN